MNLEIDRMARTGVWDPKVTVEANAYNWKEAPIVRHESRVPSSAERPALIDLFCGCGGFSVGFEAAGFQSVLGLDHHAPSLDTYAANHPHTNTICGDIREVSDEMVSSVVGATPVAVLTAGVPCQGFSRSNRKRHDEDERNFLFREFIRVARAVRPRSVVLENVSGLASSANGDFKRAITGAIGELGYDVHVNMLNAADFGVPQHRQRIFFVGLPKGAPWAWPPRTFGPGRSPFRSVQQAISDLPKLEAGESSDHYAGAPQSELQELLRGDQSILLNHVAPDHPPETVARIAATLPGKPMYSEFKQRIRLHPDLPSPTQICGGIRPQFQFGHPDQARGLTIRERARIQSFPDSYHFHGGVTQGRVQTGNAVPPFLAQAIATQIMRVLRGEPILCDADETELAQMGLFASD